MVDLERLRERRRVPVVWNPAASAMASVLSSAGVAVVHWRLAIVNNVVAPWWAALF